jgi:hypothetical protein
VKRAYLVLYEYGQGGGWAFILARSSQIIRKRFPQLKVFHEPPEWMTAAEVADIRERMTIDPDDESNCFLSSLRRDADQKNT